MVRVSTHWQWVRRVNVWLCSGMFMALRTLRGLSSIRAPVRHLFYALTHTSHFYAQPDLNVLYQAQCRPEGRAWGRGPGWEEKPLINRVAPLARSRFCMKYTREITDQLRARDQ